VETQQQQQQQQQQQHNTTQHGIELCAQTSDRLRKRAIKRQGMVSERPSLQQQQQQQQQQQAAVGSDGYTVQ
jgi:hypothetical protein